jgi:hypothetical protein
MKCPWCLTLPSIALLTKISNHLELICPDPKLKEQDERQVRLLGVACCGCAVCCAVMLLRRDS